MTDKNKMPNEIWAHGKTWIGNPSSKVKYSVHCLDADESPRGVKYTRTDHMQAQLDEVIELLKRHKDFNFAHEALTKLKEMRGE